MSSWPGRLRNANSSVQRSGSYREAFGLAPRCRWRVASKDKKFARRAFVAGPVSPEITTGLPERPQTVLVSDRVLDHQRIQPIGMRHRQTEPDGPAVVLHKEAVQIETHELREAFDDSSQVVEGVGERRWVWRCPVAESWIVGSHQMEASARRVKSGSYIREDDGNP